MSRNAGFKSLAALLFGILLAATMLECAIMLFSYTYSWSRFDNSTISSDKVGVRHASSVFRGGLSNPAKNESTIRIIILGDSFTFGAGISDNETYSKQLGSMLPFNNVEILNFAVEGANSLDMLWLVRNKVKEYDPDLVLYGFIWNDFLFEKWNMNYDFCFLLDDPPLSVKFLRRRLDLLLSAGQTIREQDITNNKIVGRSGFECTIHSIREMDRELDQKLWLFIIPSHTTPSHVSDEFHKEVKEMLPEVNILTEFEHEFYIVTYDKDYCVSESDHHYNGEGNRWIAFTLANSLINRRIIKVNNSEAYIDKR